MMSRSDDTEHHTGAQSEETQFGILPEVDKQEVIIYTVHICTFD